MKKYRFLLATAVYLGLSTSAFANSCTGTISYLGLDSSGQVFVALNKSTAIHSICNMEAKGGYNMFPSACKATYATLLAARSMERPVVLYYSGNAYTCETIPAWSNRLEFYFIEQS